jgi:hypothetical protein
MDHLIRERASRYLGGEMTFDALEEAIARSSLEPTGDDPMLDRFDAALALVHEGDWTEADFRVELQKLLTSYVLDVDGEASAVLSDSTTGVHSVMLAGAVLTTSGSVGTRP